MQELLHAHWSVLATVCLICCCAFLLNYALFFFHLMQSQLWKLNIGKRVTVNFRETSTDEPQILTQLHSDDQCTIMHKSLIWCIMTFVSLFQTIHFIPDRATDGYSNSYFVEISWEILRFYSCGCCQHSYFCVYEPQILTQLHSDDQCTIMHKSLIWCIMTFVSLFQTLHFIPDRATDGYSNSLAFC